MHQLNSVTVTNYRSIKECRISLNRVTPIVGYNNAGKSNLLSAIRWFISPFKLENFAFHDPSKELSVEGEIAGINEGVLSAIDDSHRTRIEPFCTNNTIRIKRVATRPGLSAQSFKLMIRDPEVESESSSEAWVENPTGISNALKALFPEPIEVQAMVDAAEDVAKSKTSTTIGKLLGEILQPVVEEHNDEVNDAISKLDEVFGDSGKGRPDAIASFDKETSQILGDVFPDLSVRLHFPLPTIEDMLKSGTIRAQEEGRDREEDVTSLGHGAQRSIQMALIRYLAERRVSSNNSTYRRLLLVEEPELYLHPHAIDAVRSAFRRLAEDKYQVVYCTHSAQMIAPYDVPDTVLLRKTNEKGTYARETLSGGATTLESAPSQTKTLFSLSNSSQILFADEVVLVEGRTEEVLLPRIYEALKDRSPGADKIAFVNQGGSTNTANCRKILEAVDLPCWVLVDLDFAFRPAVWQKFLNFDDESLREARSIFADLAKWYSFELADDGFPKRGDNKLKSEEAFSLFAADERGKHIAQKLHEKLKNYRIWLWTAGSIEDHVGIKRKDEATWAELSEQIQKLGIQKAIKDPETVSRFINHVAINH